MDTTQTNPNNLECGHQILIEQAWEDETGNYHDEYARIEIIRPDGSMKVKFKDEKINEFLKDAEYLAKDFNWE